MLRGIGNDSVLFSTLHDEPVVTISSQSGDLSDTRYNAVENLTLDRPVAPEYGADDISIEEARYTMVEGVTVHNQYNGIAAGVSAGTGIPCQWVHILDSDLTASGSQYGLHGFPDAGIKLLQYADVKIHNTFVEPTDVGIIMADEPNGVLVNQCGAINGGDFETGIHAAGDGFARYIVNSIFENGLAEQIRSGGDSSRFPLTSSWIGAGDNDPKSDRRSIHTEPGASRLTLLGNHIGDQQDETLYAEMANAINVSKNRILNNNIEGDEQRSSVFVEGGSNVRIANNLVWSPHTTHSVKLSSFLDKYIVTNNNLTTANYLLDGDQSGGGILDEASGETNIVGPHPVAFERYTVQFDQTHAGYSRRPPVR